MRVVLFLVCILQLCTHLEACWQPPACWGRCGANHWVSYCVWWSVGCIPCSLGFLSPPHAWGPGACTPCGAGTFYVTTANRAAAHCAACPAGTVQPAAAQLSCTTCGPGTYAVSGRTCQVCPPGTFQPNSRSTTCITCPEGTVQPLSGQTRCVPIAPGHYARNAQYDVSPCPAGKFQPIAGQSSCRFCPPGSFTPSTGSLACTVCPEGTIKPKAGNGRCTCCGANTFALGSGNTKCTRCPAGQQNPRTCAAGCGICGAGTFSTGAGAEASSSVDRALKAVVGMFSSSSSSSSSSRLDTLLAEQESAMLRSPQLHDGSAEEHAAKIHRSVTGKLDTQQPVNNDAFDEQGIERFAVLASAAMTTPRTGLSYEEEAAMSSLSRELQAVLALPQNWAPATAISANRLLGTVSLPLSFEVDFDLNPSAGRPGTKWGQVLHLTTGNDFGPGFRLPGVWMCTSAGCPAGAYALHICYQAVATQQCVNTQRGLPASSWSTVSMLIDAQRTRTLTAQVSGSVPFTNAVGIAPAKSGYASVNVWASDPWSAAAGGQLRNVIIKEYELPSPVPVPVAYFPSSATKIFQGRILGMINFPTTYTVQFDFVARGDSAGGDNDWRNILHVTSGQNAGQPGWRMPAVWLCHIHGGCPGGRMALHICYSPTTTQFCINTRSVMSKTGYTTVKIVINNNMSPRFMRVDLSGAATETQTVNNIAAPAQSPMWNNQIVYVSDPWHWAAPGSIRNIRVYVGENVQNPTVIAPPPPAPASPGCAQCPVGRYATAGAPRCEPCPAGFFQGLIGQSSCTRCPAGAFSGVAASRCTLCNPNQYSSAGAVVCMNCPVGRVSDTGAAVCTPCRPGTYWLPNSRSGASCVPCNAGSFQPNSGATLCPQCAVGMFRATPGAIACTNCPAGTFSSALGATQCTPCSAGWFCQQPKTFPRVGTSVPLQCAPGKFSATPGQTSCTDCPAGRFAGLAATVCTPCSVGWANSRTGRWVCDECEAGSFAPAVGTAAACTQCPVGKFQLKERMGSCDDCAAGMFKPTVGKGSCLWCPPGTENLLTGQSVCPACKPGFFSATGVGRCQMCPAGTFSEGARSSCTPCFPGTFGSSPGASICQHCPATFFSATSGAAQCQQCPANTFGASSTTTGMAGCGRPCPAGSVPNPKTQQCDACPAGSFGAPGADRCTLCPLGFDARRSGQSSCDPCAAGFFAAQLGSVSCTACAAGSFQQATERTQCFRCPVGYSSPSGATACSQCAAGRFGASAGALCVNCPAGRSNPLTAQSTCPICLVGEIMPRTGASQCDTCPPGQFAPATGSTVCRQCSPGTFTSFRGANLCNNCPIGKFAGTSGMSTCTDCPPGRYAPKTGASQCIPCPANHFASTPAAASCSRCATGWFSSAGAAQCINCRPGHVPDGNNRCQACPPGKFSTVGMVTCANCPQDTFSKRSGQSVCDACGFGVFASPGASICTKQSAGKRCFDSIDGVWTEVHCPTLAPTPANASSCIQVIDGVPFTVPCQFTLRPNGTPTPSAGSRRPSLRSRRPSPPSRPTRVRRSRRPVAGPRGSRSPSASASASGSVPTRPRRSVAPTLSPSIGLCLQGWTTVITPNGLRRCVAPTGTRNCPFSWSRVQAATATRGVMCAQTMDPATGCPLRWRLLSGLTPTGVRCQAPIRSTRRCPSGWRVDTAASRSRGGVTCTPRRRSSPTSATPGAPSPRVSRLPTRPNRRPVRRPAAPLIVQCTLARCPAPNWTLMRNGRCVGPLGGASTCPAQGMIVTRRSTGTQGVTCACTSSRRPAAPRGSAAPARAGSAATVACPSGWTAVSGGGCQGPAGTSQCPAFGDFKLVIAATAIAGPICSKLPSCPNSRTRAGSFRSWQRLSLGRCRAPKGVTRCPRNWSSQAPASRTAGVTCVPCLGGACPTSPPAPRRPLAPRNASAAPTRRPLRVTTRLPTRAPAAGTLSTASVAPTPVSCPQLWRPLNRANMLCEAPVTVSACPAGPWRLVLASTNTAGAICSRVPPCPTGWTRTTGGQCQSPVGVTTCPPQWAVTVPPASRRNPVVSCLAPIPAASATRTRAPVAAPAIDGSMLATMCPPNWPVLTRSNGNFGGCQAPANMTQCPTGPFTELFAATATTGVVCARVPPCPTSPAGWTLIPNGRCQAPLGVATCPAYWQGTLPATATTGIVCLAPLSELNPTMQPTAAPSRAPTRLTSPPTVRPSVAPTVRRSASPTTISTRPATRRPSRGLWAGSLGPTPRPNTLFNLGVPTTGPTANRVRRSPQPSAGSVSSSSSSGSVGSSARPSAGPTHATTVARAAAPTNAPSSAPSPAPIVPYTVTQLVTGMQQARWTALNGNNVYQTVVTGLIPASMGVTQVLVASSANGEGSVMVTTSLTGRADTQAAVLALLKGVSPSGVSAIVVGLRNASPDWAGVTAQGVYAKLDPTLSPTVAPTPTTDAKNAAQNSGSSSAGSSTGGMPTTTLIAIVVVVAIVVLGAAFLAYRSAGKKQSAGDAYGRWNEWSDKRISQKAGGGFQMHNASPGVRRPSQGAGGPQRHSRGSRGSGVEMSDAYGINGDMYSVDGGRNSFTASVANPAFGSHRLSTSRGSIGGGGVSRPSVSGGQGKRFSFDTGMPHARSPTGSPMGRTEAPGAAAPSKVVRL